MSWTMAIYQVQNKITGDLYVGSSKCLDYRLRAHKNKLRRGTHYNRFLQGAYDEYGEDALEFSILVVCEEFELLRYEQELIDRWLPRYNICRVAGATRGISISDEHKKAISEKLKGKARSEETKNRIRQTLTGTKRPADVVEKVASKRRGVSWSQSRREAQNRRTA